MLENRLFIEKIQVTYFDWDAKIYSYLENFWVQNYILWPTNSWKSFLFFYTMATLFVFEKGDVDIIKMCFKPDTKSNINLSNATRIRSDLSISIWVQKYSLCADFVNDQKKICYRLTNWDDIDLTIKKEIIDYLNQAFQLSFDQRTIKNIKQFKNYTEKDILKINYKSFLTISYIVNKYCDIWKNNRIFPKKAIDENFIDSESVISDFGTFLFILFPKMGSFLEDLGEILGRKKRQEVIKNSVNYINDVYDVSDTPNEDDYLKLYENRSAELSKIQNQLLDFRTKIDLLGYNRTKINEYMDSSLYDESKREYWDIRINMIDKDISSYVEKAELLSKKQKDLNKEITLVKEKIRFHDNKDYARLISGDLLKFQEDFNNILEDDIRNTEDLFAEHINIEKLQYDLGEFIKDQINMISIKEIKEALQDYEFSKGSFYPRLSWENAFMMFMNLILLKYIYVKLIQRRLPIPPLFIDNFLNPMNDKVDNSYKQEFIKQLKWFEDNNIQYFMTYQKGYVESQISSHSIKKPLFLTLLQDKD